MNAINVSDIKTIILSDITIVERLLDAYKFTARKYIEPDGSVTLGLVEIDLAENGNDEKEAIKKMATSILEYSEDYCKDFDLWAKGWRRNHIPHVFKALIINDVEKIGGLITCHPGEI